MTTEKFTDEVLTAFLDGEASADVSTRIAAALENDPELQSRFSALDASLGPIQNAYEAVLSAAPDMQPLPPDATSYGGVSHAKMFAAMAASAIFGILVGFWAFQGERTRDWQDYAAAYHALYVSGTLSDVQSTPSQTMDELVRLGAVVDHDLAQAPLDAVLEYKRGQVLGYQGQPLVQLAYLSPVGDPIALCLIRTDGADKAVQLTEMEGLAAAQWQQGGIAYLLIGGSDAGLIKDAAARFSDAL